MQAAIRAAAQELARGLSTGLVVWAGSASPTCICTPAAFSCPEFPRLLDCFCHGSSRTCPTAVESTLTYGTVFVAWAVGILVGLALAAAGQWKRTVIGTPVPVATLTLEEEAAIQVAEVRRRSNGGGTVFHREVQRRGA
jgi:hypothetical protein